MDVDQPLFLLGGLSPMQFMRHHWHKKPLLVRQAIADFKFPLDRQALLALAGREEVESRLVEQRDGNWYLTHGPFDQCSLPAPQVHGWTVLVQGVDLHVDIAHTLQRLFCFIPQARFDDVMISYASPGGGVGPHFDSYDVFLLQAHGKRRWRIARPRHFALRQGLPVKIIEHFEPEEEYVLEPGDMLYLPPQWAHDGIAEGECITCSIGFKAIRRADLGHELLLRMADMTEQEENSLLYRDAYQTAVSETCAIPRRLKTFARATMRRLLMDPRMLDQALGEVLTEPKPSVWFQPSDCAVGDTTYAKIQASGVRLDRCTRMLYDGQCIFINGEHWQSQGNDAKLLQHLANQRRLNVQDLVNASDAMLQLLQSWCEIGWVHVGMQ